MKKEKLQEKLSAILVVLNPIRIYKFLKTALSFKLAGSLGKTENNKKIWNWIEKYLKLIKTPKRMTRRPDGRETWNRLSNWDKDSSSSERLGALIVASQGYNNINPSHPMGGSDNTSDIICIKDGVKYVVGCFFPRGQKTMKDISKKFSDDFKGVAKNSCCGFIFITNQELKLSERTQLIDSVDCENIEIYHLEFISSVLNTPLHYGTRLEFLGIEMTTEEHISYTTANNQIINDLRNQVKQYQNDSTEYIKNNSVVIPESYEKITLENGMILSPIHKCSKCGFGFKIMGFGLNSYDNDMKYYIYTGSTSNLNTNTIRTVTCPTCSNTDNILTENYNPNEI